MGSAENRKREAAAEGERQGAENDRWKLKFRDPVASYVYAPMERQRASPSSSSADNHAIIVNYKNVAIPRKLHSQINRAIAAAVPPR